MNIVKQKRKISLILVLIIIIGLFSACDDGGVEQSGATKTVTDCVGRTVEVPENPERVGCFYASIAHMIAMVDEGDKLVAVPKGVKTDELMLMKYPEIADMSSPYSESSINIEELTTLQADLAIIRYSTAENAAETEKLDKLGIPYIVVDYLNVDELKTAINVIGDVFDKREQTESYISFIDETLDLVNDRIQTSNKEDRPVVYHSVNEAIRTDIDGDICMEITSLAGVRNAAENEDITVDGNKNYTTLEEIYKWNPDAVIANEYSVTEYILTDAKWSGLDAVKDKKVYTLPVGASRWCHPGSMEPHMAVLFIAKKFYPEEMKDVDIEKYTKDYYKEYFDLDLDDATVKKVLSGKGLRKSNAPVKSN